MDPMTWQMTSGETALSVHVGEAFTVCRTDDARDPGWLRNHPRLTRLPNGRLVLAVNRDRDIVDAEMLMLASDDAGQHWQELPEWPGAGERGRHLQTEQIALPDGTALTVLQNLFATDEPGVYVLPSWRSTDGGTTWGEVEAARVTLPLGAPFDIYDPPQWFLDQHPGFIERGFRKPEPPPALLPLLARFGRRRILTQGVLHALDAQRLLAFFYLAATPGEPYVTVCLASDDAGRSWRHLSTPGPHEPRYATENFLTHGIDGLCEPSVTRLDNGSLLLVMRLGSRHPLYAAQSADEGRTWTPPRPLPVWGILPTVLTLPGGTLALLSGRPHITLSFSFDGGYRWPCTLRFLEDGKAEDASTRNNTMLLLDAHRLLVMYDHGGWHPGFVGERRIVGHVVEVNSSQG